jgi:hypothetical protein
MAAHGFRDRRRAPPRARPRGRLVWLTFCSFFSAVSAPQSPPQSIRIRDIARGQVYERGPGEPALRGPYELFRPTGAVRRRGNLVDYLQGNVIRSGRVVPTVLGETQPGERVLVKLPPAAREDQWWLCDVEAVDGIEAAR